MYTKNESFFKKIDTESKAYFLGLLYADGYNRNESKSKFVRICLQSEDEHILKDFQKELGSNYVLKTKTFVNENHKDISTLQINSKEISDDLVKLGCFQKKSLILEFPTREQVLTHLVHHFIRGYFDGDGSIWEGERKMMYFKSRPNGKIIHNVKFNITGTIDIINNIQYELIKNARFNETKINTSKKLNNTVQLEYSGRINIEKFYNYLYHDATVYFNRKKNKFRSIILRANMQ